MLALGNEAQDMTISAASWKFGDERCLLAGLFCSKRLFIFEFLLQMGLEFIALNRIYNENASFSPKRVLARL